MILFSACLQQTKQSLCSAYCLFSVLLEYFAVVAAPYIYESGRWRMLPPPFLQLTKQSQNLLSPQNACTTGA